MKAGRVSALASTSRERSSLVPGVPTIAESGYPGFEADTWYGMLAPAKVSPALVNQANAAVTKMLAQADFKESLAREGAQPAGSTPEQFAAHIKHRNRQVGENRAHG